MLLHVANTQLLELVQTGENMLFINIIFTQGKHVTFSFFLFLLLNKILDLVLLHEKTSYFKLNSRKKIQLKRKISYFINEKN